MLFRIEFIMKKLLYLSLTALFCFIVLTACDKKQHAIDNLSDFVEKVKKEAPEYTSKDWEEVDKEYDEIIAEIEKYDYSSEETKRIAELKGKYIGIKTKDDVRDLFNSVDKTLQEIKGTVKGIKDGILGNEVQPLTNETDSSKTSN